MLQLARTSDGNHTFVGETTDLIQVFNKEFDDVLASCAQTVSIDVELKPGVRVVRALSRDGKIEGQTAQFQLNQIYAATEHYVLMEVEVDQAAAFGDADIGRVRVTYTARAGRRARQTIETPVRARFSESGAEIAASRDNAVIESVVEQSVRERTAAAITLRDQGRHGEAQALFRQNVQEIDAQAAFAPLSGRLQYLKRQYDGIAATPPTASSSILGDQRKFLRQLDANPAALGSRY
jgi:Ca-activated chloride channel homolog